MKRNGWVQSIFGDSVEGFAEGVGMEVMKAGE